jgi:uncharacterized SAM-binding protein YcdF (DUF218 family)/glycosyltransferase involved in cell wall biosynthesis
MNPLLQRNVDILCISTIDWDFIWQGHQEIMSTFAAQGHRVLFIENTGVRPPSLRDLARVRRRLSNWWRSTKGFRQVSDNLFLYSPLIVPLPYSQLARWVNRSLLLRSLRRWMAATGFNRPITWTFLPTPLARDLVARLDSQLTIYYCIDDLASSSPEASRIAASEEQFFRDADLVFVTSEQLRQRASRFSDRVHLFPFGVSLEGFERVRASNDPPPADIAAIPKPIVGYVGGLHQWVDRDLLSEVARRMPEASIVLVGPEQADMSALRKLPNVHLLGLKQHADVPHYVKAFDVGLVPYRLSEYTANVYPTKLNEYLAMGTPVVATDLVEIRRFNADHGDIVSIAGTPEACVAAIRRTLQASSAVERERRISVARTNSWTSRIDAMSRLIDDAIAAKGPSDTGWEDTLRRAYRATRRRAAELVVGLVAVYLLLFQTSFIWWCAAPLLRASPPVPADAIVVFAGGVGESGQAGGGYQERVKQAIDLYKVGYARHLVLSSGYVYSFREAEVMGALAVDNGVPLSAIVLELKAKSTYDNVRLVKEILDDHRWTRILLVSSPYHMRRAMMTWHREAPAITVVPTPPPQSQFYDHTRGATLEQIRGIVWEYLATFAYWRRGWL